MPTLNVCPKCRTICPLCHSDCKSNGHSIFVCHDCKKKYEFKCCVCGGKKTGPGTSGATGGGRVCDHCNKNGTCVFCGVRV